MFSLCCPAGCGGFYMLRLVTVNADIPVKVQYSAMITLAPVDLSDSSTKSMIDVAIWFQVNKTLELSSGVEKWINSVSCVWVVSCIADVACVYEKDLTLLLLLTACQQCLYQSCDLKTKIHICILWRSEWFPLSSMDFAYYELLLSFQISFYHCIFQGTDCVWSRKSHFFK